MTPFNERADRAIAKLKADIEAMATEVRYSDGPRNEYGGTHVGIANGSAKTEGGVAANWPGLNEACALSLEAARNLTPLHDPGRDARCVLFWRMMPEWGYRNVPDADGDMTEQPSIYMRLSFESWRYVEAA